MRSLVETLIGLTIAVSLVRGLAAEGFMISTGSMAPTLVGFHCDATCPHCRFAFDRGSVPASVRSRHADRDAIADEDRSDEDRSDEDRSDEDRANAAATDDSVTADRTSPDAIATRCPNCGESFTTRAVRTEGDQLLVHKLAYERRDPRRWEVVVFRNPSDPDEAYIKRVAGLPGEQVHIQAGDLYANGQLCRKDWPTQNAMRLPVADADFPIGTDDDDRWPCDPRWTRSERPKTAGSNAAEANAAEANADEPSGLQFDHVGPPSSIRYRHRVRSGGRHATTVPIARWPTPHPPAATRLQYHAGILHCTGAIPEAVRDQLLTLSPDPDFQRAIDDLFRRSRRGYITDDCGYNRPGQTEYAVRDLMWTGRVQLAVDGRLDVRLLYGRQPFVLSLAPTVVALSTLDAEGQPITLRQSRWSRSPTESAAIAFSVFDRQLVVVCDGQPIWRPIPFAQTELTERPSRTPLTLTAAGRVRLTNLALWRDVYITPPEAREAITLDADSFYMLGDNSPVSIDSRRWPIAAVPRSHLIGKPLVVHLPSRKVEAPAVGWVRVPDVSRMRLIR